MPLSSSYNAVFTITRQTRSGTDDGTPIYTDSTVVVAGWFDEIESRPLDEPFRSESIPYTDRRALFMCDSTADVRQDDEGVVVIGGINRGTWAVSILRTAPIPSGVGHMEIQLQGTKESK